MAISGTVKPGSTVTWGFLQESTFGTKNASSSNYIMMEGPVPSVDYGVFQDNEVKHRGQMYADSNDDYTTLNGGVRVISFSDVIVRRADLAELLYAVTQTVSEGATTPYQKDFNISSTTTSFPDFTSNAGYFATLFINDSSGNMKVFPSCILRTLTLSADVTGQDGRLRASGEWISGFDPSTSETQSGTPAFNTQAYYNWNQPTAKSIAGSDIVLYSWEITITNNAVRVGNTSGGEAETYGSNGYEITGSVTTKFDTNTIPRLESFLNGTAVDITLEVGSSGSAGFFSVNFDKAKLTGHEIDYGNERGLVKTLPFIALGNASTNPLCDIQVDDGTDQGW